MLNNTVDMLMNPAEMPTLLRSYDLETIAAVGKWGLDMIKRYPCTFSNDGCLRGSMAEVCAAIFCMGHYIGRIEAIQKARSQDNSSANELGLIDPAALENIDDVALDDLFNDLSPVDQQRVLLAGLKVAGIF